MLAIALTLLATTYKPNPFTVVDDHTTIRYYTESSSATYTPVYDSTTNTLTFPDDSSLSYAGKITIADDSVRLFPFKLIIRIKNASASTTLGNGLGFPAGTAKAFDESPVMYVNVVRYRTGGPGMETTIQIPNESYLSQNYMYQLYRSGIESSSATRWTPIIVNTPPQVVAYIAQVVGFVDGADTAPETDSGTSASSGTRRAR